jgi:hypothetical protein
MTVPVLQVRRPRQPSERELRAIDVSVGHLSS